MIDEARYEIVFDQWYHSFDSGRAPGRAIERNIRVSRKKTKVYIFIISKISADRGRTPDGSHQSEVIYNDHTEHLHTI